MLSGLLSAVALFSTVVRADHLPANLIALGRSERVLAGITIDRTTLAEAEKLYGKPGREDHPDDGDPSRGQRRYFWDRSGVRISAWTWFQPGRESAITAVEIFGSRRADQWKTGRGLYLGATIADVRRVYGQRFLSGRNAKTGNRYLLIQWRDETEMDIDFGAQGRIVKIQLAISVE